MRFNTVLIITLAFCHSVGQTEVLGGINDTEKPPGYFSIKLFAPACNPSRVQHAQVITRELWKIGIDAELWLVAGEALTERLFKSVNFEGADGDGFDIGFFGFSTGDPLKPSMLSNLYHSSRIDKEEGGQNFFPINSSKLDRLLDSVDSECDFGQRREYVRKALDIIIWEEHPVMGLYQYRSPFVLNADLRGFDTFRWSQPNLHVQELHYASSGHAVFTYACKYQFLDLNPALSDSYYDSLIYQPTQAWTFQQDANSFLRPVLAKSDPIAIGSNDSIASYIALSSISPDSPYANATTATVWGPNPNVNATRYTPCKTALNKSMFLINLRKNVPWHPGWGYTIGQRNVTVEDFQWTLGYLMDEELNSPYAQDFVDIYGANPGLVIEKINDTMFKLNLRGSLSNGQVADWHDACALCPLPRHVLDPAFNATPYGGGIGVTPDNTVIAGYENHTNYAFNTGEKPVIGTGPYYFESWNNLESIATLRKFDEWGGSWDNQTSLWDNPAYARSNIDTYEVAVYPSKESAAIALENGDIDGIDSQFRMEWDVSDLQTKPNIQVLLNEGNGVQAMAFNTYHPNLSDHYVRLAISHLVPAQKIVDYILGGWGAVNEAVGLHLRNPFMPSNEEWKTLGLNTAENVIDPQTGELLEFQGHISYNIHKAWGLMEKAGYDMNPWREAVPKWERTEEDSSERLFLDISASEIPIFALATLGAAIVGIGLVQFLKMRRVLSKKCGWDAESP